MHRMRSMGRSDAMGGFAFVPFLFSDRQIWIGDGKMAESSLFTACRVRGAKCQSAPQKALLFLLSSTLRLHPTSTHLDSVFRASDRSRLSSYTEILISPSRSTLPISLSRAV